MKKRLSIFVCAAIAAACVSVLSACANQPLTVQQQIAVAQAAVGIACDTAATLVATGDIHGKDAENVGLGCATAPQVLSELQAVIPPAAASAPAVGASSPATSSPAAGASTPAS